METRPDLATGTHRMPLHLGLMACESRQTCVGCQLASLLNLFLFSPLRTKLTEMKGYFDDEFAWWTANYLVDQRISAEPNNHQLYLHFLDVLDTRNLPKLVLHETLVKSAIVLNNKMGPSLFEEPTNLPQKCVLRRSPC